MSEDTQHRESDMSKAYPSNLTQPIQLLNDLIPAKSGGRPREVDMWRSSTPFSTSSVRDAVGELCQETCLADGVHLFPQLA